jgi:glycosyltransferase involved in cell wall biosynthesis
MKIYIDGSKRAAVSRMFPVWESWGHKVVDKARLADVQLSVVRIKNRTGLPTVLRLDGVYYDAATDYNHRNESISKSHMEADALVYQSVLSKMMCEKYLGDRKGEYRVIHNGIDQNGWNNPKEHLHTNIFCCGKWRRPKRLKETIEVFKKFRERSPYANLWVVGGFKKGGKPIPGDNIFYTYEIDHNGMKELYRIGDMFLHLCKKDSCPSTVVEAIAAGMPAITTDVCGGATEMCAKTPGCKVILGEELSLEPDFIYQDKCHKIPEAVIDNMVSAMTEVVDKKTRVSLPKELTIDYVAKQYIELMESVC